MKQFSILILVCLSFAFAACKDAVVDSKTAEVSVNHNEEITAKAKPTLNPNEKSTTEILGKCQPKNDVDELISMPESREKFNDWLSNIIGSVQVATLANREFVSEYYWEGDLNADGCKDVAILVQGIEGKSGEVSMENFVDGTTVQNLRSKAIYKGGDTAKFPFSSAFARQVKPQQKTALAILFGNRNGWSWKNNAMGREFLLYDSVFELAEVSEYEATSLLFSVVNKAKPEEDYEDLIDRFPSNTVGDCIYTATEVKQKKNEFSELSNKFLICYDGNVFFHKKLPDSKSYPEL